MFPVTRDSEAVSELFVQPVQPNLCRFALEAGAMKKLIVLTLLSASFLGGYHLGHLPDSPDIFGIARDACGEIREGGAELMSAAESAAEQLSKTEKVAPPTAVEVNGWAYQAAPAGRGPGR